MVSIDEVVTSDVYMLCSVILELYVYFFFLMIRRPPRSTLSSSSAASDVV